MRTIKFRAYRVNDTSWAFGDLVHLKNDAGFYEVYIQDDGVPLLVDPDSVGQFTGIRDKKGRGIYEGDIVRYRPNNKVYQVVFKDGIFWGEGENGCGCAAHFFPSCEIIGNVFDNTELIEKGGEHE